MMAEGLVPARWRPRDELTDGVWLLLLMRIGLGGLAVFIWAHTAIPGPCHFEIALDGWKTVPPLAANGAEFPLVGVWQRWDACWYSKIATFGYERAEDSPSFWPLLPGLMRLVALPFGGQVALSGLIVVGAAYVMAVVGLWRLVAADFDRDTARWTVLFLTVAPAAVFLFAPFTEAPFLALSVWAILCARRRRWVLAAVFGLLAGLTRIQGVFLLLPLAWEAWSAWRAAEPIGTSAHESEASDGSPSVVPLGRSLVSAGASVVAATAPAIGFISFLAYTHLTVGRTPLETQDVWGGKNFHAPWDVATAAWQWTVDHHDPVEALNLAMLLLFIALAIAGLRRLPASYSLYAIPQIALIAIRIQPTPLTSTMRLLEVVFPGFVVVALAVRGRRARVSWAVVSILLLAALTWLYVTGDFVA